MATTTGTPYIGSKISLISKAEIRYEGVLYDVNSKEATVTLSKVRSYGTEGRPTQKQIPPRNEVYEYIIFRGSDIKDLSVSQMGTKDEEPPVDPAIVSAHTAPPISSSRSDQNPPPPSNTSGSSSSILPTPSHPVPGSGYSQFPPGLGGYNPFGMPYFGRPPMMMGQHLPHPMHPMSAQPHPPTPPTHISTISSGTPSTTPLKNTQSSLTKSPSETTPSVVTTTAHETSTPINPGLQPTIKPSIPPLTHSIVDSQTTHQISDNHRNPPQATAPPPPPPTEGNQDKDGKKSSSSSPSSGNGDTKRQSKRGGGRRGGQKNTSYTPRGPRVMSNWRGNNYSRPPRGGGYVPNRPPPPPTVSSSGSVQPLKYTKDFDFESANALFSKDQLEKEMKLKLKISDDQKEGGSDGGELPAQEQEEMEEGELNKEEEPQGDGRNEEDEFYDKSKSFFDTISCESTQHNTNRRSNRSQEMALNTETFGVTNRGYSGRSKGNQGRGYNPRYRGGRGYYSHYNGYGQYRGGGGYYGGQGGYYGGRGRNYGRGYGGYDDYQGRGGRSS